MSEQYDRENRRENWYLVGSNGVIVDWDMNESLVRNSLKEYTEHVTDRIEVHRQHAERDPEGGTARLYAVELPLRIERGPHADYMQDKAHFIHIADTDLLKEAQACIEEWRPEWPDGLPEGFEAEEAKVQDVIDRLDLRLRTEEGE